MFVGPEIKFSKINGIIKTEVDTAEETAPQQPKKLVLAIQIMLRLLNLILMKKL